MDNKKPIIALDFTSKDKAREFLDLFPRMTLNVKIGMELFYSSGPDFVREVVQKGHSVFLDLKLYDIPNTIEHAMKQLSQLGVSMLNVHASGGVEMMEAARRGLSSGMAKGEVQPILIGVTQLTSRDPETNAVEMQLAVSQEASILNLAELTKESGLDGVVCSPLEVEKIHHKLGLNFLTITPGIRPANYKRDDQVRVTTPAKAASLGSDYIVVGRPITKVDNPVKMYEIISKEWQEALGGLK